MPTSVLSISSYPEKLDEPQVMVYLAKTDSANIIPIRIEVKEKDEEVVKKGWSIIKFFKMLFNLGATENKIIVSRGKVLKRWDFQDGKFVKII